MSKLNNINIQDLEDNYDNEDEFYQKFKERLADVQSFPGDYSFKFILPAKSEGISELKEIFGEEESDFKTKTSSKGTYTSITIKKRVKDAAAVVYYYKKCAHIKNIMML